MEGIKMVDKVKSVYFLSVIEGDFLVNASISNIIRKYNTNHRTVCLLPDHPRVKNNKLSFYYNNFDEVVHLPFCSFSKNIFKGIIEGRKFIHELGNIHFNRGDILFMFDIYTLPELIIYTELKHRYPWIKLTIISYSLADQFDKNKTKLLWKQTFINSFYSIYFNYLHLFRSFKRIGTDLYGFKRIYQKSDFQICIENSKYRTHANKVFLKVPYPLPAITFPENSINIKFDKSILILISSAHGNLWPSYWVNLRIILDQLIKIPNTNILIKDHPGFESYAERELVDYPITMVDKKIFAEQVFLDKKLGISTVIGYASTALITASWMRLSTIDYTQILGYSDPVNDYYNNFIQLGENIHQLKNLSEFTLEDIHSRNSNQVTKEMIVDSWLNVLNTIFQIE